MVNFFVNYIVKVLLNAILAVFFLSACVLLACTVIPLAELEAVLNPAVIGTELLKQLPIVGKLADYLLNVTSISMNAQYGNGVSILSQVTFGMLVLISSEIVMPIHHGIRRRADLIAKPIAPLRLFNNMICFGVACYTAIAAALIIGAFLDRILSSAGYLGWAVLLGAVLLLAAVLAVKLKGSGMLKVLLDFVFGAFSTLLVCFASILLSCLQNLKYSSAPESALIVSLSVIVILALTCIGACLIADLAK